MRRWFLGLAVAVLAAGTAAADDRAAIAVVKKAIDAHGGADNLNKYKAGKTKMSGEVSVGGMDIEFTGTLAFSLPDRYKLVINAELAGEKMVMEQVVKGDEIKTFLKVGGEAVPLGDLEDQKEEAKTAAVLQDAEQLTPLLDAKKFTLKSASDADVNGKKAAVVVVQPKALKKEVTMFFDKESGLLLKTAHKTTDRNEAGDKTEILEESYAEEYKKVKGIQVPLRATVYHDGKKFMTVKLSDYEVLEKLEDKEFTVDD
jgi:outer membrane lipoprotein-sorting protein